MKLTFEVEEDEKEAVDEVLSEDPIARLSITQRSAQSLGFEEEGSFFLLEGDQDTCEEARKELKEHAEELTDSKKEEVLEAIKEEEEKSMKGFGSVFGG